MKYIKYENLSNPFKVYKENEEPKNNRIGHSFIDDKLFKGKMKVVAVFESLQEFKGFFFFFREEIIKDAKPCKGKYYFLKMRKTYPESVEDYGLYVFDNVSAAEDVKDYLLNNTKTFSGADIRIVDKDDNEIEVDRERE